MAVANLPTWAKVAVVVALVGVVCMGSVALFLAARPPRVQVINDSPHRVRLVACVDSDGVRIEPGEEALLRVRRPCPVYLDEAVYAGCLFISSATESESGQPQRAVVSEADPRLAPRACLDAEHYGGRSTLGRLLRAVF